MLITDKCVRRWHNGFVLIRIMRKKDFFKSQGLDISPFCSASLHICRSIDGQSIDGQSQIDVKFSHDLTHQKSLKSVNF